MINRIKALLAGGGQSKSLEKKEEPETEPRLAAAALLVEQAKVDGDFDDRERRRIFDLLADRFALNQEETETLIRAADEAVDQSSQLYAFTRLIKDHYTPEQRIGMIEMLWEVAYADGRVDHFEANLMRRVGGLIHVSDRDRGEARKRVIARLGITETPV